MNNTAISAGLQIIVFASEKNRDFYEEYLPQCLCKKVGALC